MSISWNENGYPYAAIDDFDGSRLLTKEWIANDDSGKEFGEKYNSPKNAERLAEVLNLHGLVISSANLTWVFLRLKDSGQLAMPQAPIEPDVPRDRNGKPLSESQIAWGEMVRWSESASSKDIESRRKSDPAYREFYLTNLKREMNQPIDGATIEPILSRAPYLDEGELKRLRQFAHEFTVMPTRDSRNKFLAAYNPEYKSYAADFDLCCRLQLL